MRAVTAAAVVGAVACSLAALAVAVGVGAGALMVGLGLVAVAFVAVPVVGSAIARARPGNAVGWILVASGVTLPVAVGAYAWAGVAVPAGWPGAVWAGWLDGWPWVPAVVLVPTVGLLLFPDGHLPSPRWRPLLWLEILVAAALAAATLFGSTLLDFPTVPNPTALPGGVADPLIAVIALVAPLATASAWSVQRRLAAARGTDAEHPLTLVAPAGWLAAASWWSCVVIVAATGDSLLALPAEAVGMVAVAAAAWVAIRRHGLFDVRVVVSRAIGYAVVTGCVLVIYLAVAALADALAAPAGEPVAVVVAVLAALPLRDVLQRVANHLVFGDRDDPYAALDRLGQRLTDAAASDDVLPAVVRTTREALRLPFVEVRLGDEPVAAAGRPGSGERETFPLTFAGEAIGVLTVEPREGRPLPPADRRLLTGIARQVAVAARAVSLTGDLMRSRERIVAAAEDERRRLRRDLHDGLGPGLAGMVLGLQRARKRIAADPDAAAAQLDRLTEQVQAAVAEVRRLVHGLRPPALDELGLVGALDEQARALGATIVTGSIRGELPAAVEVAAYRIALEAMTNTARHARAHSCEVRIGDVDGAVRVEVDDDGIGLTAGYRAGVGISSMRERAIELGGRCTIERRDPTGTAVRAHIPVGRP